MRRAPPAGIRGSRARRRIRPARGWSRLPGTSQPPRPDSRTCATAPRATCAVRPVSEMVRSPFARRPFARLERSEHFLEQDPDAVEVLLDPLQPHVEVAALELRDD